MDISAHEDNLSQPLQTDNEQFKTIIFPTSYNGIFNITNKNNILFHSIN